MSETAKACSRPTVPTLLGRTIVAVIVGVSAVSLGWVSAAHAELELVDYDIKMSLTAPIVDDDDSSFRQRHGIDSSPSGGVEGLFMQWRDGAKSVKLEGRGVVDNHDYLFKLDYDDPARGHVSAGFREFRTWYDASGGFFPQNGAFLDVFGDGRGIDRGRAWFDGALKLPDLPQVSLKYGYHFRDGSKQSTVWGDSTLTGGFGTRSIANAFRRIDEDRNSIEFDVKDTIGKTNIGIGFRYQDPDINNKLNLARRPGESGLERVVTQKDSVDSDLYNAHAFADRRFFEDKLFLSTSYSFMNIASDIGGSRIYGNAINASFDPLFANRQQRDTGFLTLGGDTEVSRHVGTVNAALEPRTDMRIRTAFRVEGSSTDSKSRFDETSVGAGPTFDTTLTPLRAKSSVDELEITQDLEIRYTGIENLVLYATGEWEHLDHDVREKEDDVTSSTRLLDRKTDVDRFSQEYGGGLNWYPLRKVSLSARGYWRDADGDYNNKIDSTDNSSGNRYPAYFKSQDIETYGGTTRVTWKALSQLRMTSRYDLRISRIRTKMEGLDDMRSAKIKSHVVGTDINWSPLASVYVNAMGNYVRSETDTPANQLSGAADSLVTDFDNDYWNANVLAGWAVNRHLDLESQYFFLYSDNYKNNSAESQPYGLDSTEHGVTLGLTFRPSETASWTARYGYFTSDDDTAGGHDDYHAHVLYWSVEFSY